MCFPFPSSEVTLQVAAGCPCSSGLHWRVMRALYGHSLGDFIPDRSLAFPYLAPQYPPIFGILMALVQVGIEPAQCVSIAPWAHVLRRDRCSLCPSLPLQRAAVPRQWPGCPQRGRGDAQPSHVLAHLLRFAPSAVAVAVCATWLLSFDLYSPPQHSRAQLHCLCRRRAVSAVPEP